MKRTLSEQERKQLDALIADVEKRTKTQIVLALIQRSDIYAELPWKAFALGASVSGLLIFILDLMYHDWYATMTVLMAAVGILAGGFVLAVLTLWIPGFAKRFLPDSSAEAEVRQYAESLFLSRELFATSNRTGILVLVSLFERKVIILPDQGLSNLLTGDAMQRVITSMTDLLKRNELSRAFEAGLEELSRILGNRVKGTDKNELSDEIIEEKGV